MLLTRAFLFLISVIGLMGCEGHFVGERPMNVGIFNGTYEMKIANVNGSNYLVVLNTNYKFQASGGSLQFYLLDAPASPTAPVLQNTMSVSLPSNVGDFVIDGERLYVADRNEHHVLVYDLVDGKFTAKVDGNSNPYFVNVSDQPQRLIVFSRLSDRVKVLAVLCQGSGTIHFIRTDTFDFISNGDTSPGSAEVLLTGGIPGAQFTAYPRQFLNTGRDDPVALPQFPSYGINNLLYLDGPNKTDEMFVTASTLVMGIMSFRLDSFQNTVNLSWNLPRFRDGENVNGIDYPGTKENGFRGLARDGSGNVYATSRSDNSLYVIPRSEFTRSKQALTGESPARRNTRGFGDDDTAFSVKSFDTDRSDNIFPRLGPIAVNYCPNAGATPPTVCRIEDQDATVAWILAAGTKDGDTVLSYPKVYRLNLVDLSVKSTPDSYLGESPQRILWYSTANLLYVANVKSDSISILNADTLDLLATLKN
jgi:hypothetical protein